MNRAAPPLEIGAARHRNLNGAKDKMCARILVAGADIRNSFITLRWTAPLDHGGEGHGVREQ
jgi:hypothetical protein